MPDEALALVRACQRRVPAHLAGGAALSGAYLAHRLSGDLDLFCHQAADVRLLVRELPDIGTESGVAIELVHDAGTFVRARVQLPGVISISISFTRRSPMSSRRPLRSKESSLNPWRICVRRS